MSTSVRHNDGPTALTTHLFWWADIESAGLTGEVTDEPVTALCGAVRSYGPWSHGVPDDACANCRAALERHLANDADADAEQENPNR